MALEDLLRTLEQEGAARAADVRRRAREEAEQVRGEAERDRERRRTAALHPREVELRAGAARELEAARRAAAARRLAARARALDRIRGRAEQRLAARADDDALLPLVRRDLLRALEYAGDGAGVVMTSAALVGPVRAMLHGGRSLQVEAAPIGGVLVRAADGAWSVDATFRSRLERAWPRLAIGLTRRLEAET